MAVQLKGDEDPEVYEALRHQRQQIRRQITQRCTTVEAWTKNPTVVTELKIEVESDLLKSLKSKADQLNSEIVKMFSAPKTPSEAAERQAWEDKCTDYEEKAFTALRQMEILKRRLFEKPVSKEDSSTSAPSTSTQGAVAFPKDVFVKHEEKIPKFAGDAKKFHEWFERYESAVSSCANRLEKFVRLKGCLVGNALRAISHLHLKEEFYDTALGIIKEEYGSVFSAQYAHAAEIINICSARNFKNPDKWHWTIPLVTQNIKALKTLVSSFEGAAVMILPTILDNLPSSVRDSFLRVHEVSTTNEAERQLDALLKFLGKENKIRSAPAVARANVNPIGDRGKSRPNPKQGQNNFGVPRAKDNHSFFGNQVSEGDHSCLFCNMKNHTATKCRKVMTNAERAEIVGKIRACVKCLKRNHMAPKCRLKVQCKHCSGPHHALLCINAAKQKETSTLMGASSISNSSEIRVPDCIKDLASRIAKKSNLATGYAYIMTEDGIQLRRILLDIGSQRSYITTRLARLLRAPITDKEHLINHTLGGQASEVHEYFCHGVNLVSRFAPQMPIPIECLGIPVITDTIFPPAEKLEGIEDYADHVQNPEFKDIDLLIGTDNLGQIWMNTSKSEGRLIGLKTRIGWFTFGRKAPLSPFTNAFSALQSSSPQRWEEKEIVSSIAQKPNNTERDIEFLFQTELLGIEPPVENESFAEQQKYDELFKQNIRRNSSGRYCLKLIFNESLQALGDNEKIALSRLNSLVKRSTNEVLRAVDEEISSYIENGYAESAPKRKPGEFAHYLPLQVVKKPDPAQPRGYKIRLVKDAGCRSSHLSSLNDVLITGPNLLPNILLILARFRAAPIIVVADIERAFHQFEIDRTHRTFLRFFWRQGIADNPNAPIKEFWSKRLDFGTSASPWLYQAGIKFHLDGEKDRLPRERKFIEEIQSSTYMDDLNFGATNVREALAKVERCKKIFNAGHFPLKKWACNSKEVATQMTRKYSSEAITVRSGETDFKFLGIRWCQNTDSLGVFMDKAIKSFKDSKPSKRSLLSGLAQIFDPLGIISPITIQAKTLFQSLWTAKVQWDDNLNEEHLEHYRKFAEQLEAAKQILARRSNDRINRSPSHTEIHAFADASKAAYGAVIYLREFFGSGKPEIKFIMSKAKVAPNKGKWNIHRLELMAALVAVRLVNKLKPALGDSVSRITYWADNSAVIGWTREKPSAWKTFVANRISEIQRYSTPDQWSWVATSSNPADLLSRGCPLDSKELSSFWLEGPSWLSEIVLPAPTKIGKAVFADAIEEARRIDTLATATSTPPAKPESCTLLEEKHFSSWPKAVRTFAFVLRFAKRRGSNENGNGNPIIDSTEYCKAEIALIRNIQRIDFPDEVASGGKKIAKSSKLFLYNPVMDGNGILRCKSRLEKSGDLSFGEKFPILLEGRNYFTRLLIAWIHESKCLHSPGITTNLHHIRTEYLILKARSSTKKVLKGCLRCARYRAKAAAEVIPPLPAFRIEETAPFSFTGVDFAGPITVKDNQGNKLKAYITLYVCAVSRAVHLDLTPDLTTYEFLLTLRKFINRHSTVRKIISDNASTFKRAEKELELANRNIKSKEIQNLLAKSKVEWEFITDRAPTQGAFWERIVQLVKRPLRKVLGTNIPGFRELESILSEIELCINLRPITALTSSDCEMRALCPADLVNGYHAKARFPDSSLLAMPELSRDPAILMTKAWKRQESIMKGFWKRFREEYLGQLRSAHEIKPKSPLTLSVGDVCLLADPSPSRGFWPLCKIVDLFGGQRTDLRQRSCMVKLGNGKIVKRPISMIYPLGFGENI